VRLNCRLGKIQEAVNTYAAVVELDPENMDAQLKMANFLMLAQKYDEARGKGRPCAEK
jgi:thioredoxin-like negative regulator of GroEL